MLKNSLKILQSGFLAIIIGGMNSANGMDESSSLGHSAKRKSITSSSGTSSGITTGNIQEKLRAKINRDPGLTYARSLFSQIDLLATISRYATYNEQEQNKIRNAVITVAVYGNGSSLKGLASDKQSGSESTAITVGLCHFLCKVDT